MFEKLEEIYKKTDLLLPDGMPLIWASKLLGTPLKEKISGPDLLPKICAMAAKKSYRIFLLGGRAGVAQNATTIFGNKYNGIKIVRSSPTGLVKIGKNTGMEDIKTVYETALRERKMIPGLIMIIAHGFGFNQKDAQRLAALAFFAWGDIVSYDNVVDEHLIRKGASTDLAEAGLALATGRTMIGIADLLSTSLTEDDGVFLTREFLRMLRNSCKGDLVSRQLTWSDPDEKYLENMRSLIEAFSWYPDYMGQRNGMIEAERSVDEQSQFSEVLDIGKRYKKEVVMSLYPAMKKIYQEAQVNLLVGFQGLPDFDYINTQYYEVLFQTLTLIWQQFCRYGEIEEIE